MLTIIIIGAVFLCAATLAGGVALVFYGRDTTKAEDRLANFTGQGSSRDASMPEASVLAQPLDDVPGAVEEYTKRFLNLRTLLDQADLQIEVPKFLMIAGGLAAVGVAGILFIPGYWFLAPLGAVLGVIPFVFLWWKRGSRLAAFGKQIPEALELISRALRAGHSLASGLHLVSTEMKEPISKEFARAYEEQNFGIPLEEALEDMTDRVPNLDLRFFVTAIILQRQTGGDLAEILDKIGYLVRERFKIFGQVQALTGEGRLSGVVLLALPPVLFVVMWRLNADYVSLLFTDPLGNQMLAAAIFMQLVGAFVIKKIVSIKV